MMPVEMVPTAADQSGGFRFIRQRAHGRQTNSRSIGRWSNQLRDLLGARHVLVDRRDQLGELIVPELQHTLDIDRS